MDALQQRLTDYAYELRFEDLSSYAIDAAKARLIDTLGAIVGGFSGEPCRIARALGASMPQSDGATIIGTRIKTSPDMAAFVNATTARYLDFGERGHGGPSDVTAPVLSAAEHAEAHGRDLVAAMVLADNVYCRLSDISRNSAAFGAANFACISSALAAGKLLGLSRGQLAQSLSLAAVTSVTLNQVLDGEPSMWDQFAAGSAGRAGLFAALTARQGMEGPAKPFEGKTGWSDEVAGTRFTLDTLGDAPAVAGIEDAAAVEGRFRSRAEEVLGPKRTSAVLDRIWNLENLDNVSAIPAAIIVA
jgi:2-methylcitrate dehydratase